MFSLGNLLDLLLGRLDEGLDLRVSRAAPPGGAPTSWEARIYRLADGRAISEIAETLFAEEARAGAWAVDIGVWHDVFCRAVAGFIDVMVNDGWLLYEARREGLPGLPLAQEETAHV